MNIVKIITPKRLVVSVLALFSLFGFALTHVEAARSDASINLTKDPGGSLFTLTIKDTDGIQEFSLSLVGRYSYGGGLNNCPKSFSSTNVGIIDPSDFTPVMPAYVIDCKNNKIELEIAPPINGVARSRTVKKEETPALSPPLPQKEVMKKEGPLSAEDIQYPVPDLGNCQSDIECRSYCDNVSRAKECLAFAKKYHLISAAEAEEAADKFLNVKNGPGGCSAWSSCEAYCSSVEHLDECIAFAEETGYYSPEELAPARKFQGLVKAGTQFPGGCTDRNSCEIYCGDPTHMEECLDFAEVSGFMPPEEIAEARKFMTLMRQGESPGGCTSKEQCENYCFEESHIDECIAFAEKAGVMSAEDAAMARKVGGKGPGGCRSKEQCEAYCQDNGEECFHFAEEHGLLSEDDLADMREGMSRFRDGLDRMPPEAVECIKNAIGEENFNTMLVGEPIFDRGIEEKMKSCFGEVTAQLSQQLSQLPPEAAQCIKDAVGEEGLQKLQSGGFDENLNFESLEGCFRQLQASFGGGGNFGAGGFSGPGGCTNTEECIAYCEDHLDECQGFSPPNGGIGGVQGGPGGCTSEEECQSYCEKHSEECSGGRGGVGGFSGPGGCSSEEECMAYCTEHPTECGGDGGGGGAVTQGCVEPPSGLVSWWSADVASGTTVPDMSNGNNGAIVGGVSVVPMEVGSAFQFDGSSGHISMGNPANLNFGTGPFSVEAWFNWNGGGNSGALNIIRKSNYPASGPGAGYWLRIGRDSNIIEFSIGATTGPDGQSIITAPVRADVWHHVVGTKDSSGNIKLYVDGEYAGTLLRQAPSAESTSEAPFTLGAWDDRFGITELFPGLIDEVSVYNRALSASDVENLFAAGSVGKCSVGFGRTNREVPQEYQQQYQQEYEQQQQPMQPPINYSGPGGCTSAEECTAYCTQNYQDTACQGLMPPPPASSSGSGGTEFSGPGGCKTPEECRTYCTQNYQDAACQQFAPSPPASVLPFVSLIAGVFWPWLLLLR